MHAGYDQANKLVCVFVLCLGSKAVVFLEYLHKYHLMFILSGSELYRARVSLYCFSDTGGSHMSVLRLSFFQRTIAFLVNTVSLVAFNCSVKKKDECLWSARFLVVFSRLLRLLPKIIYLPFYLQAKHHVMSQMYHTSIAPLVNVLGLTICATLIKIVMMAQTR